MHMTERTEKRKQKVYEQLQARIKEDRKLVFIKDLYEIAGMSASTFYKYYQEGSEELQTLTDLLDNNKTTMKREIRDRLMECKNPAALIFLYKVLTTDPKERAELEYKPYEIKAAKEEKIELEIQ